MCFVFSCNGFNVTESFINSQSGLGVFESGCKYNINVSEIFKYYFYSNSNPTK